MAKDYAKKRKGKKKSGASRGNKNNKPSIALIFTAILLIGGLTSLLIYLKWYQVKPTIVEEKPTISKKIQDKKVAPSNEEDDEVPFYKTHQEMVNKTVEIPLEDLKLPEGQHDYEYLMPCGSFKDNNRAEELKAQIALVGYESKINHVKVKSESWYRVELGPYKSKRKTESIRHRLQDNGFNYCKIWPKRIK